VTGGIDWDYNPAGMHALPDIGKSSTALLLRSVSRILRPLVRILLRNGIACRVFEEAVRKAYVDEAFRLIGKAGKRATVSAVAARTGLSRKEVARLRDLPEGGALQARQRYNRAVRVISGWMNDERFTDAGGVPRPLPFDGDGVSFVRLCRDYSGDVTPRSMLELLVESGSVELAGDGVRLVRQAYLPGDEPDEIVAILGTDVPELIETIDHNLRSPPGRRWFQRKVQYDAIPREALAEFEALHAERAQALLETLDAWLSRHDRPDRPAAETRRVAVAITYHEDEDPAG